MIILQDVFSMLTNGAYANTAFSGTDNVMKEVHYNKVINLINLGVIEIYKRFKFLENELVLHVMPETTRYYLRASRVAPISQMSEHLYIEESPDTNGFLNIIKITGAFNSSGVELRINYPHVYNPTDTTTPTIIEVAPDVLQVTNILSAQTIGIVYQAYPTKIPIADFIDPETYELDIPDIIIDPLLLYIAAKTFKPMGSNDSTANADKSAGYEQQYELACQKLAMYGLPMHDTTERDTFDDNGWV